MNRCSRNIAVVALAFAFIFGIAGTSFAQEEKDIIRPITKEGSAAFIFNLAGLGTFGFSGPTLGPVSSGVGAKWFLSDDLALRVIAGLSITSGSSSLPDSSSVKPSSTTFGIGAGIEKHFRPLYSTSPYVGAQVFFGNASTDNGGSGAAEQKTSQSTFGVQALAGFDWFFTHGLALGGEMTLGFTSQSGSTTQGSTTNNSQSVTTIALATGGNVHFVVYF